MSLLTTLIVSKNSKLRWGCLPKLRLQGFPLLQFPEELETRFLHLLRIFLWFSILFPFPLLMPRLMVEYTLSFILKKSTAHTEENVKMATKRHSEYVTNDGKNLCFWVDLRLHIITNSNTHSHAYILQEWHIHRKYNKVLLLLLDPFCFYSCQNYILYGLSWLTENSGSFAYCQNIHHSYNTWFMFMHIVHMHNTYARYWAWTFTVKLYVVHLKLQLIVVLLKVPLLFSIRTSKEISSGTFKSITISCKFNVIL